MLTYSIVVRGQHTGGKIHPGPQEVNQASLDLVVEVSVYRGLHQMACQKEGLDSIFWKQPGALSKHEMKTQPSPFPLVT